MCVKIIKCSHEIPYDAERPLEEQIHGSEQIIVNFQPEDPEIKKFLDEVERICQTGVSCNLNILVRTNNMLNGARVKRRAKELESQIMLNDAIKLMALAQAEVDKKLEELSEMMKK